MTKKEVIKIKEILSRIKNKDGHVEEAIAVCDKQLAIFRAAADGLRDDYEYDRMVDW